MHRMQRAEIYVQPWFFIITLSVLSRNPFRLACAKFRVNNYSALSDGERDTVQLRKMGLAIR